MISTETQRVLIKQNGAASLVDHSDALNNFREGSVALTLEDDGYIYIGQYLPFTSRYFDITGVNSISASLNVELWQGDDWQQAIDIRDRTTTSGAPLAKNGYIHWRINRDEQGWQCENESQDIPDLSTGPQIYDYYWLRISTSVTLDAITLDHLGNLFSTDSELYSHYPALDNQTTRDQWNRLNPGTKTDWMEQGFIASEFIIRDLKERNIILEDGQVFDISKFNVPSIHKQANLIYGGLGRGFQDQQDASEKAYQKAMSLARLNIDKAADGRLRGRERLIRTGFATR